MPGNFEHFGIVRQEIPGLDVSFDQKIRFRRSISSSKPKLRKNYRSEIIGAVSG